MRVFYRTVAIVGLATGLATAPAANAWGADGHIIVAEIAQSKLKPPARREIMNILRVENAKSLSAIANWADKERAAADKGKVVDYPMPSHVTRLPLDHSMSLGTSCPNFCAVKAINYYAARLGDRSLSGSERAIALNFVVHLVGDLHQPLHSSKEVGIIFHVMFAGKDRPIHWVWDNGIMKAQHKTRAEMLAEISRTEVRDRNGDALQWAFEGRDIARDNILPGLTRKGPVALPDDYAVRNWPIVKARIKLAGIRLAGLLNDSLK